MANHTTRAQRINARQDRIWAECMAAKKAAAANKAYDTVYRHSFGEFTGVPIAQVSKGIWYWPDYETARDFAQAFNLRPDRIIPYSKGWAIQLRISGPYVKTPKA